MVTAEMVKNLREKTQAGLMDCKEALVASNGDFGAAEVWLRKKNLDRGSVMAKSATEGRITIGKTASIDRYAMVEMTSTTDFAANSQDFMDVHCSIAWIAAEHNLTNIDAVKSFQTSIGTIEERLRELSGRLGENIGLKRVEVFDSNTSGFYIHSDSKQGAIVELEGAPADKVAEIGKDISMHIVFAKPNFLTRDEVPAADVAKEEALIKEMLLADPKNANKPPEIIAKISAGKMNNFFAKSVLPDQPYYREQKNTVAKTLSGVKVVRFARFEVGAL